MVPAAPTQPPAGDLALDARVLALVEEARRSAPAPYGAAPPVGVAGASAPPGLAGVTVVASTRVGGAQLARCCRQGRPEAAGASLVHATVDDLFAAGARALLVEVAVEGADLATLDGLVSGAARACRGSEVALGDVRVAGPLDASRETPHVSVTAVGALLPGGALRRERIAACDRLLALAATGLDGVGHAEAERVLFGPAPAGLATGLPRPTAAVEADLAAATRSFVAPLRGPVAQGAVRALVPVREGGLLGSLVAALPQGLAPDLDLRGWELPALLRTLRARSGLDDVGYLSTWNAGVGMVAVVAPDLAGRVRAEIEAWGEPCREIGGVVAGAAPILGAMPR